MLLIASLIQKKKLRIFLVIHDGFGEKVGVRFIFTLYMLLLISVYVVAKNGLGMIDMTS